MPRNTSPDGPKRKPPYAPLSGDHKHFVDVPRDGGSRGLGAIWKDRHFEITEEEIDDRVYKTTISGDETWDELTKQMIQNSCAFFAQEVLTGPPQAPYNGRFLIGDHHEEWDDLVLDHDRVMVEAPRDHGKTFFFDFAYPLWKIVTQPGGQGFIFSNTKEQAIRILADIKYELENNPRLRHLVPSRKAGNRWSQTSIQCTNGHRIYARGFGTKVRGAHPNWIVVDDGLNDETAYSELIRRKQIEYFYSAITNMIVPGGQIIVVGTPFHSADLYADLSKNPGYEFRRYQALNGKEERPLWPERYTKFTLIKKRIEIGSVRFTREFQCEPISDDMSLFPGYLFTGPQVEQPTLTLGMPKEFWDEMGVTIMMGVDFALSASVQADYTVIWTMGIDDHGNRWIIDIQRGKGMGYQDQLSKINEIAKKYDPALVFLEANQAQRIFGDELIRTTDIPIKLFTTHATNKHALDKGVPSLRVLLENGKFRIPRGDARSVEVTNWWRDEMRNMTWVEGKVTSVGTHDDTVMACWICDQAIRAGGFSFDFGDEVGDGDLDDVLRELTGEDEDEAVQEPVQELEISQDSDILGVLEQEPPGATGNLVDLDDGEEDQFGTGFVGGAPGPGAIGQWL